MEDIEGVKRKIDSFSTPDFESKYEHKGIFLGGRKAVEKFNEFWSEQFIKAFVEELEKNISVDIGKLTDAVVGEIDNLSPAMKANQEEIDNEKAKQELLREKREKSAKIRLRCKKLYEEGIGQYV